MAHTLLSRSNELLNFTRNINLDESTSSSDAGDVLIRATKIHFPEQSYEGQRDLGLLSTISNKTDNVKITVKKLRNVAQPSLLDEPPKIEKQRQARKQEHRHVHPALRASLPSVSPSEGTKASKKSPIKSVPQKESHFQVPNIDGKETPTSVQPKGSEDKGHDLLISRYAGGGKGAILAALRQRSQTAPLRREVKVQLLDQGPPSSQKPQPASVLSGDKGAASTAAMVTTAATAPLVTAQSDMDACVSQVSEGLRRLLESDRYPGRAQEAREDRASEKVTQLEEQLNTVTQQRLQHLEWIQSQQMELQNRLLGSALSVMTAHAPLPSPSMLNTGPAATVHPEPRLPQDLQMTHLNAADSSAAVPATASPDPFSQQRGGGGKSPLETPAPRRVIPKPTRWNPTNIRNTQNTTQQHSFRTQKTPRTAQQENGRLLEAIPNSSSSLATRGVQQQSSARVAIATPTAGCQQPAQSREGQHQQEVSNVTSGVRELVTAALAKHSDTNHQGRGEGSHQPGLPSSSGVPAQPTSAVKRANDILQDLGRLKTEMQTLLQARDAFPAAESRETVRETASARTSNTTSSSKQPAIPAPTTTHHPPPPPCVSMSQEEVAVVLPPVLPLPPARPTPTLLQQSQPCPSMFEDAERVLRQVQRHKKTLEENLEAMLRAKDGETLHSQLEALSCNRDTTEEVRIKKTVDAWINALSKDIQADITKEHLVAQMRAKDKVKESTAAAVLLQKDRGTKKDIITSRLNDVKSRIQTGGPRTAGSKPSQRAARGQTESTEELINKCKHTTGPNVRLRPSPSQQASQCGEMKSDQGGEEYLVKLYGKALYEGNRRTLKKGPYLRFNSPSPKSKAPRPRVVESVRGVKMKSSKTQTSLPHGQSVSSPLYPAVPSEPKYIFSPTRGGTQYHPGTSLEGYLIPMAIPLGQPRVDGLAPQPSRVLISDRPVMVTTSMPPSPPRPAPAPRKPTVAILEVVSGPRRRQPQLQVQVQPSVNIEPLTPTPTPSLSPAPFPSAPPPPAAVLSPDIPSVEETHDDEESVFPGTHFLEVADIAQDPEEEAEELHNGPIELNGLASPPTAMYHGPLFPCYPAEPLPAPDPVLSSIQHRETLENRLVDWVEQQLMARMISEMYQPPLADPAQNQSPSHSEPEDSATSDIVEAAGGEGLQLFVDASVPVDTELIRQYVNEALAETIALMLGQREGQERPVAPAKPQDLPPQEEPLVPTPVPTPEPIISPGPPSRGLSPLATPQASEQGTPLQSPREPQPPEPHTSTPADPELIVTPVTTPAPSLLVVSPPSGPAGPWGEASLPLAEEQPHSPAEEQEEHNKPLVMSVAEEEPVSVPPIPPVTSSPQTMLPSSPTPPPPPPPGPQTPSSPSSSSSSSSESSSSGSSSTVTGTDTAARHISEGELLLSYSQAAAARAFEEEGFYVPYLINSFSSSLQEVQDMDYDPPSEGQVRRPVIPAYHDPILSLLAKMDQGVATQTRPDPEGSWEEEGEEEGEVSEGQRPRLHPAGERLVTGHPLTVQPRNRTVTRTGTEPHPNTRQGRISSPGQLTLQSADVTDATSFQDTQRPVDIRDLDVEPEMPYQPPQPDTSMSPPPMEGSVSHSAPQAAELSGLPAPRPAPILVRQFQKTNGETSEKPGEQAQQGSRVVAIRLPFTGPEEEEEEEEEVSVSLGLSTRGGVGDTDSSGNDMF
ncbi:protein TALPID3 isoform X1 [Coregonus clupeaformis]|uniref:protein TALPID3 isoform X1 n=1 Tax=Coregonus clupeaformis TaxID=59861 RepID=UPI001E1C9610|nr:protein TALPID3 isoform X1 [Coregonus clupeaformis]